MHARTFSWLQQAGLPVINHALVINSSAGFSVYRNHKCDTHAHRIAVTTSDSLTGTVIHDGFFSQNL